MIYANYDEEKFYLYALELFTKTGHAEKKAVQIANLTPEEFLSFRQASYKLAPHLQPELQQAKHISCLFTARNCGFYSMLLLADQRSRSKAALGIHKIIQAISGLAATICLFKQGDEVMLSCCGFGCPCVTSAWYPLEDEQNMLLKKLDLANICLNKDADYFQDIAYLAADYQPQQPLNSGKTPPSVFNTFDPVAYLKLDRRDRLRIAKYFTRLKLEYRRPQAAPYHRDRQRDSAKTVAKKPHNKRTKSYTIKKSPQKRTNSYTAEKSLTNRTIPYTAQDHSVVENSGREEIAAKFAITFTFRLYWRRRRRWRCVGLRRNLG